MKLRELLKDVSYELVQGNLEIEVDDISLMMLMKNVLLLL